MKSNLLIIILAAIAGIHSNAQVTQINSNKSLEFTDALSNNKAVFVSAIDNHLWATIGTLAGTIELSTTISYVESIGTTAFMNGKFIFAGNTAATGTELYITDGTPAGTILLADINTGPNGSSPSEGILLNGFVYFTASRPAEGRELWRTDGTPGGTTLVKDIVTGPTDSNYPNAYHLFSNGSYLLFMARTPSSGVELWTSDGTGPGTVVLKDINPGPDSSAVQFFQRFNNNTVLFLANDGSHGVETWKTNGTPAGTTILKDINVGPLGSGPLFGLTFYFVFNGKAFFTADDGTNGDELWSTDGTELNTSLLKNIGPGPIGSFDFITDAVVVGNKFIFPSTDFATRFQLWQSDGTPGGTTAFKDFEVNAPFVFLPYSYNSFPITQALFQGNKFFFMATTDLEGNELWVSDGTVPNTHIVKDINPADLDGIEQTNLSYLYTSAFLFFPANDGTHGSELWKSDGTSPGTTMMADIITNLPGSEPDITPFLINSKVVFGATNGDDPVARDLYAVDGTFSPVPLSLGGFTVIARAEDALLNWYTLQESNSRDFTIQRSTDGSHFENIGVVAAIGNSTVKQDYHFTDIGILKNFKKTIYYRLLSADNDNKTSYSKIISLKPKSDSWNVSVLANPVSDNINLSLTGVGAEVRIAVIDTRGNIVYNNTFSNPGASISIPANNLPHGFYVLRVVNGGEVKRVRFVK